MRRFAAIATLVSWFAHCPASRAASPEEMFQSASAAVSRGAFLDAIADFRSAAAGFDSEERPAAHATTLYNLAIAFHAIGNFKLAFQSLDEASAIAAALPDAAPLQSKIAGLLGSIGTFSRKADTSGEFLAEALASAESRGDEESLAWLTNDHGILLASEGDLEGASTAFANSLDLARSLGLAGLATKVAVNSALAQINAAAQASEPEPETFWGPPPTPPAERAAKVSAHIQSAIASLDSATTGASRLGSPHEKAMALTTVGDAYARLGEIAPPFAAALNQRSFTAYSAALKAGGQAPESPATTYALGRLARRYEADGRNEEALGLTQRARDLAQQQGLPEALYQWDWQIGRNLLALGRRDEAIAAYVRAETVLATIRHDVAIGYGNRSLGKSFREAVGGLYFELADLTLDQARAESDSAASQALLKRARGIVESFKSAELEDYFQDDCVNLARESLTEVGEVESGVAAFYFIPLADRTEILVNIGPTVHRFTSETPAADLDTTAREFRTYLEASGDPTFFFYAQELYDQLIRPAEALLAEKNIDTLVFIPDGALRNIPMAALHDGEKFLVEKWASAVSPGLELVDPQRTPRKNVRMLVGALTEAVQGFAPLPAVEAEAEALATTVTPAPEIYKDQEFLEGPFESQIAGQPYQIVHMATHGEFLDNAADSFVLTFDGKLHLDDLERAIRPKKFVGTPVELLGLSACKTASGNDRAALGLAGVAVKAGARSAFATLWSVDDIAAGSIVSDFYKAILDDPEITKAEALRQAQVAILQDIRYAHPRVWGPFLIIGNWL